MGNILHDVPSKKVDLILLIIPEILGFHSGSRSWWGAICVKQLFPIILFYVVAVEVIVSVALEVDPSEEVDLVADDANSVAGSWGVVGFGTGEDGEPPMGRELFVNL